MASKVPRTLLVLKPSSFGDIIHTLPAVARLKAGWPECRISWLINPEWVPLLDGNPDVDEIIPFPRGEFRGQGGWWRMAKWLRTMSRRPPFDLALDFQGLLRTAVIGRVNGAHKLVGLSDAREGASLLYDQAVVSPRQPVHAIARYQALADVVLTAGGIDDKMSLVRSTDCWLPAGEKVKLEPGLDEPYILFHPYSRGKGKSLSNTVINEIIRKLSNSKIVVVGRADPTKHALDGGCLDLTGQTSIAQLVWLIRNARFVLSVDSGPAHLAAALDKKMVAIHSWSDPRRVGPYFQDAWVWKNGSLVQVRDLATMTPGFFAPKPLDLRTADIAAIAALATSS